MFQSNFLIFIYEIDSQRTLPNITIRNDHVFEGRHGYNMK